jgi:NTP pyrophosphatase (non-canonical NTP hydrolase)
MRQIIEKVKFQQEFMGYADMIERSSELRMVHGRDIALALIKEVSEVLDEMPWKPWRPLREQPCNQAKASHEIADVIVFAVVLHLTLCPGQSLEEAMQEVLKKVDKRIETQNYGKQGEM